jgi:hypothetical protein
MTLYLATAAAALLVFITLAAAIAILLTYPIEELDS